MYETLTFYHSIVRWLLLSGLLYALYRACKGYRSEAAFSKTDDLARHWTATIAHIQLIIGILLYTRSPIISYFWKHTKEGMQQPEILFFSLVHFLAMLTAIVVITIGSALSKRQLTDRAKFKTMFLWYLAALCLIFIAIPWPFSPFANRPFLR